MKTHICACLALAAVMVFSAALHAAAPALAGCPMFPADNAWNTPIDTLPVHPNSAAFINTIGAATGLHPDFGTVFEGAPIGIPFVVVDRTTPRSQVTFEFADESDRLPYPIPPNPPIEGGVSSTGDRHILMLEKDECKLYELFSAYPNNNGTWRAGSGAVWDLRSHALRPIGWTSADAAGLPILPGLVRYDEVLAGEIAHAIRFAAVQTKREFVWPARHFASSRTGSQFPPLGQRFRLKANFDISGFSREVQAILRALKKYGLILADNGSNWYVIGAPDSRWNDSVLVPELRRVKGSDFEAVDTSSLVIDVNSGQARSVACPSPTDDADRDGVPCSVELAEGLNPATRDNNIFADTAGSSRLFVMQQFRDFLGREGDASGVSFWLTEIGAGRQSRSSVVDTFFNSPEFQNTGAAVARLYFATYQRLPDSEGLNFWIGRYRGGTALATIGDAFAAAPEFAARYGALDNAAYINQLYTNVLGRPADAGGLAFWQSQLAAGVSRGGMLVQFSESTEYRNRMATSVYVTMIYQGMLRRAPDQAGFDFWRGELARGRTGLDLIIQFLPAAEYRSRFLPS